MICEGASRGVQQFGRQKAMVLNIIGEHPLVKDASGAITSKIATLFPASRQLITLPGVHATQRLAWLEMLKAQRLAADEAPLTAQEEDAALEAAVDLIVEGGCILIRPDPDNMPLAFAADELLQTLVPKRDIRFLFLRNPSVRDAIKRRGECWRINPLPLSSEEMQQMIVSSRMGIGGRAIYYYNKARGQRLLTYQEFCGLGELPDAQLRQHLIEIQQYAVATNRLGTREIGFFMSEGLFGAADLASCELASMPDGELRTAYQSLRDRFRQAVKPQFRRDDVEDAEWRQAMFAGLMAEQDEMIPEETLLGLSSEFFMQIEWLPGGRIEDGELILDPVLEEAGSGHEEAGRSPAVDTKARGFIFNFIREHGNLEYINIGRVKHSLSQRVGALGRRDVYIAQLKRRDSGREIVRIIRMQKWGIREHLDGGKSLLDAIVEAEEYTEYIMDRRLGCRQLGMHLPDWTIAKRISERYAANQKELRGRQIWSCYFERDYIRGIATDKLPRWKLENPEFALRLGRLLGRAAAANLVVGRCDVRGRVIFADGDEIVIEDSAGMPCDIIVADHTGTFSDYRGEFKDQAEAYADAVNRHLAVVPDPRAFAEAFLAALEERFSAIQKEYRRRQRAFDTLFKHRPWDEGGSFAFRWQQVLARLDRADAHEIAKAIRAHVTMPAPGTAQVA